jgi:hypothetical protein
VELFIFFPKGSVAILSTRIAAVVPEVDNERVRSGQRSEFRVAKLPRPYCMNDCHRILHVLLATCYYSFVRRHTELTFLCVLRIS